MDFGAARAVRGANWISRGALFSDVVRILSKSIDSRTGPGCARALQAFCATAWPRALSQMSILPYGAKTLDAVGMCMCVRCNKRIRLVFRNPSESIDSRAAETDQAAQWIPLHVSRFPYVLESIELDGFQNGRCRSSNPIDFV